jgi:AraC-like DNA-binding protein
MAPPEAARRGGLGALPSTGGIGIRLAYRWVRDAGLDPLPLLKEARVTAAQIADPVSRFSVRAQIRFLDAAAEALGDELLGFHLARDFETREMGALHYVVASSATIEEALRRLTRFSSLIHEGMQLSASFGRELRVAIHYVGVPRRSDRHQAECWLTVLLNFVRQLSGRRVVARSVHFAHSRPNGSREIDRHFGAPVEFDADVDEVALDGGIAALPAVSADPYLNKILLKYCEEALGHRPRARGTFRTAVENAVVPELPHGDVEVDRTARRLGMSRRTIARKLAAEGLTYSVVLEELRLDLARRYLADPELSIAKIAWLLGYREASAFSRAFRRWTGGSPRAARSSARPATSEALATTRRNA